MAAKIESCINYRGVTINRVTRYGGVWYEFVLNHAPYGVPTIEECEYMIDIVLA